MADGAQENNDSSERNDSQPSSNTSREEQLTELSGWLTKRSKLSHKWKKQWFHLKNTDLLYGNSDQVLSCLRLRGFCCNVIIFT